MDGNRKENSCSRPVGWLNQPDDDGGVSKPWLWKISNCFSTVEQILPTSGKTKNCMESNKSKLELKDFPPPSHHAISNLFASAPPSDIQAFQQQQSTGTKVSCCPHCGNEASCSLQIPNGDGCIHSVKAGALEHTNAGTVTRQVGSRPTFHSSKSCKVAVTNDRLAGPCIENTVSGCQLQPPLSQHLSCCGNLFKQLQPFHSSVHKQHQTPMQQSYNASSFFSCMELTGGVRGHLEDRVNQAELPKRVCTNSLHFHMAPMFLKGSHYCDDCLNKPPRHPVIDVTKIWPNIAPPAQSVPVPMSLCNGVQIEGQTAETPVLTTGSLGLQPQKYGSPDVGVVGQQENLPPIGVFWDIENCSVPTGRSAMTIVQRIRQQFFQGHREAEFMCVCDISKENKEVIQELNNCQVTVAHINATAKNAADDKLRQSLRRFADTHTAPSTVILVSSDVNFALELSDLRHRHGFQIILVHKNQVSDALLQHAHKHIKFEEFVSNLPPRLPEKMPQCHTLLYAYNLPLNRDSKQVSNRLRRLSDNCGGKVLSITGSSAILRFTSQESAERAQKRMENEDVFGNKILVSFTPKNKDLCESKNNCFAVEKAKSPKKASKLTKLSQRNKGLDEQLQNGKNSTVKNTPQGSALKDSNVRSLQELCGMESKTKQSVRTQKIKKQGTESPPVSHCTSIYSPPTSKNIGNGDSFSGNIKRETPTSRSSLESPIDKIEKKVDFHVSSPSAFSKLSVPRHNTPPIPGHGTWSARSLSPSLSNGSPSISANQTHYSDSQTGPFANGADIQVSNLDYRMSRKELQQTLHEIFLRHGKVKNVELSPHTDYQLKAVVQMGSLQEAISAINSLHRYKIGSKRVQVSLATGSANKSLALLGSEAMSILQDSPACCLPLFKFTELYEKRFGHKLVVSDLYKLTDTVAIRDQVNGRMVCLLPGSQARQSPLGSVISYDGSSSNCSPVIFEELEYHEPICRQHCSNNSHSCSEDGFDPDSYKIPFIILSLKTFAPQVHSLLHTHEGTVPLLSFLDCYAAEFTVLRTVEEGEGGVPLEHLITCVPGVNIVTTQDGIKVVKWVQNKPPPPNADPWLLRCKSPVGNPQLIQFSREVIDLLKTQAHCLICQHKFIPTYHHHFGKQCRVSDYGYSKLVELLEAVPHVLQILGLGTKRLLTLTHRAQVKRFTQDLLKLLKSQASKQVLIREFEQAYHWCFSKDWNVTDYGVCELADLLSEMSDTTICVSQQDDDTVISIPKRERTPEEIERTKQFAKEVVDLLRHQSHCRMPFNKFIPAYHHHFGRQCKLTYYGFNKLMELFEAIPDVLQVLECGDEKILVLTENEQIKALTAQLVKLLRSQKDNCMTLSDFLLEYNNTYGYTLRLQDYDVSTVAELMQKLCHVAKIASTPAGKQLQLINRKSLRTLTAQLLVLLMSLDDVSLLKVDDLKKHFDASYGNPLVPSEYGFMSLTELLKSLPYLVEVITDDTGEEYVKLTKVYQFAKNVRALLHTYHYQQIFLTEFPSTYHKYTGEVLQPKVYGYASIEDLLIAIPQVIWIKGHGHKRIVVLKNDMKVRNNSACCSPACMVEECEQTPEDPKRPVTLAVKNSNDTETKEFETSSSCSNQAEQELLCLSNQSPVDLLCGPVPSCLPSPQLRPDPVILENADLIRFEEQSPNVADMLILKEEEKTVLPTAMTEEAFTSGSVSNQIKENIPTVCQPEDVHETKSLHVEVTDSPIKKPRSFSAKCMMSQNLVVEGFLIQCPQTSSKSCIIKLYTCS
ncbi:meiosis regulator and mRNA stability factor 1 isoform X1 [Carcharodon carcharias]|uniref:meiosis regulator and mRNA stability factor 1 isoform X1 n=1 Tax=Carcharodon carcharias TaxID=13397 RepID=UPI001B7EB700|nr:meiosis regulator and mRNA stability factor 1 isoform X1 [Carcharodon carcharias]XP_041062244.1 meiosis regulator and mRNA stability factor 1 isoform X1 [Carcharodon carcharias]